MIYDSLHDFLYTGIGICIGILIGMFISYCKYYNELQKLEEKQNGN